MRKGSPAPNRGAAVPHNPEKVLGRDARNNAIIDSYISKKERAAILVTTSYHELSEEALLQLTKKRNRLRSQNNESSNYKNKAHNKEKVRRPRRFKRLRAF